MFQTSVYKKKVWPITIQTEAAFKLYFCNIDSAGQSSHLQSHKMEPTLQDANAMF